MSAIPHNGKETWFIYVLRDPRNLEVRYVGATGNPALRLTGHVHTANLCLKYNRGSRSKKTLWLCELLAAGLSPSMELIQSGTGFGRSIAEKTWIKHYAAFGPITNSRAGGGGDYYPIEPEPEEQVSLYTIVQKCAYLLQMVQKERLSKCV